MGKGMGKGKKKSGREDREKWDRRGTATSVTAAANNASREFGGVILYNQREVRPRPRPKERILRSDIGWLVGLR